MLSGKTIREKRKAEKLSVEALAKRLDINKDNLYKWEKGTKITDPESYLKLQNWLESGSESIFLSSEVKGIELRQKVEDYGSLLSVLVSELASLRSSMTGEHAEVITKKIYKAAEDLGKLKS